MMTIEERLENMEREVGRQKRRTRWLLGAVLLVAGGLIVPGMFETTAIRARAQVARTATEIKATVINATEIKVRDFVLEDKNGEIRAMLLWTKMARTYRCMTKMARSVSG